tara:strand:+ start:206 stop:481 length:276 start_codon:yes stop_codon:yes gene_type:complete
MSVSCTRSYAPVICAAALVRWRTMSMRMSDDLVCIHHVIDKLDRWLDEATTITGKTSDGEYINTSIVQAFKSELIFNLGVNQRIAWHDEDE